MTLLRGDDAAALDAAARRLADGGLVAFPTETVYGLGARADDDAAVAAIFDAKRRPTDHPLIVHVSDLAAARHFANAIDAAAQRLIAAFWPGPLTVIVPRAPGIAGVAAAGQASIGLRCPAHPVARALLRRCAALGVPGVAAPSANRFGRVSPTTAQHVVAEFGPDLLLLDGGACTVGIESAIVDCSRGRPVLLRPGVLTRVQLQAALGQPLAEPDGAAPRAPGTLEAHYAPAARVRLLSTAALRQALHSAETRPGGLAVYSRTAAIDSAGVARAQWARTMPDDPALAAHELFAALREFDALGAAQIWIEQPPATPDWEGVRDRLRRAAAVGS